MWEKNISVYLLLLVSLIGYSYLQNFTWTDCIGNPEVVMVLSDITISESIITSGGNISIHFEGDNTKQIFSSMTRGVMIRMDGTEVIQQFFTDTCKAIENYCPCPCDSTSVQGDLGWRLINNISPGEMNLTVSSIHPSLKDVYFYCFTLIFNITE